MINWKERYDQLAQLTNNLITKLDELNFIKQRIHFHLRDSDRENLRELNLYRFCKLKEDYEATIEYQNHKITKLFPKGTLIKAEYHKHQIHVYLDEDGDGNIFFPSNLVEVVELTEKELIEIPNNLFLYQG